MNRLGRQLGWEKNQREVSTNGLEGTQLEGEMGERSREGRRGGQSKEDAGQREPRRRSKGQVWGLGHRGLRAGQWGADAERKTGPQAGGGQP